MYASFQDKFCPGHTEIWYAKPEYGRAFRLGVSIPLVKTLKETHVRLGTMALVNLDLVFDRLQGEKWSPNGEARNLIRDLGLCHTSMSVGDVIRDPEMVYWMVDGVGFKKLS